MNFNEYQQQARQTAIYPGKDEGNITYPSLGLAGEAGEVCEKVKKIIRDHEGHVSDEQRETLKKELGDVLWYVASLAAELELDMDSIARTNINKLLSRQQRNQLHGSGDER